MGHDVTFDSQLQAGGPDPDDTPSSPDSTPLFHDIAAAHFSRRSVLGGGLAAATLFLLPGTPASGQGPQGPRGPKASGTYAGVRPGAELGFESIPLNFSDQVTVPPGYSTQVLIPWGTPVQPDGPAWAPDASNPAAEQAQQIGMGHDGMHFFPIDGSSSHGLLVLNFEFTVDAQLFPDGLANWDAEKTAKSQAAHGVGIVEVRREGGAWQVVPSRYARRITANTPISVSGPAAGHRLLRTNADPGGTTVLGTLNTCSMGVTPWGTYVTCEENANGYFYRTGAAETPEQAALLDRYGYTATGFGYLWATTDARFRTGDEPNEPNRHHWCVEIDPFNPNQMPVKRTAMGRFKHEGVTFTESRGKRVVAYMGDDQRFDHIYKFVGNRNWTSSRARGVDPLDDGVLYTAVFEADGTGRWEALTLDNPVLADRFTDMGELLVNARTAADLVGATRMDRPEWIAVHPRTGDVYCTLTNNTQRTEGSAANPVAPNPDGHIIRWQEAGGDAAATMFTWDIFLYAGATPYDPDGEQDILGATGGFGSADGLWFDADGRLWIQTDGGQPEGANDQMLAADPATGQLRRFLGGVPDCEVTGVVTTPDQRTMFVNIQHPGDAGGSDWPDKNGGLPRPATVVVTRDDGGVIGT